MMPCKLSQSRLSLARRCCIVSNCSLRRSKWCRSMSGPSEGCMALPFGQESPRASPAPKVPLAPAGPVAPPAAPPPPPPRAATLLPPAAASALADAGCLMAGIAASASRLLPSLCCCIGDRVGCVTPVVAAAVAATTAFGGIGFAKACSEEPDTLRSTWGLPRSSLAVPEALGWWTARGGASLRGGGGEFGVDGDTRSTTAAAFRWGVGPVPLLAPS
mmetsp:Transcript_88543/g.249515  ORF Transcript_88543/g.249515 Transcript_88543/m.249515 type:complete len:217 (-) Transcript_88543:73-723(-)